MTYKKLEKHKNCILKSSTHDFQEIELAQKPLKVSSYWSSLFI